MKKKNNGGFSWSVFFGLAAQKRKISRMTGIPFTSSGRKAKLGSMIMKIFKFR